MSNATSEHPSVVIQEEMDARGWDRDDLAAAMMVADDDNEAKHRLVIDLYFLRDPRIRVGGCAESFARAFGTSADLWRNLDEAWRRDVATDAATQRQAVEPSKP